MQQTFYRTSPRSIDLYKGELEALTYPEDGAQSGAYAFYDRYAHQFNTATEADTVNEGWGFAAIVGVAAQTGAAKAPWTARGAAIATPASASKPVTVTLSSPDGVDLGPARVTWEAANQEPFVGGTSFTFTPVLTGPTWVDAEAMLPDGRRLVAGRSSLRSERSRGHQRPTRRSSSENGMRRSTGRPCGQWPEKSTPSSAPSSACACSAESASPARTEP